MHPDHPAGRPGALGVGGSPPPLLDADTIVNLRALDDGGDTLLAEVVGVFHAEAPERVAQIRRAAAGRSARELVAIAHALKGSARSLGLFRLADLCQQIEQSARAGRVADPVTLQRLDAEVAAASRALTGLGPFGVA